MTISRQVAPAYRDLISKIIESHALGVQILQESNTIKSVLMMVAKGMGRATLTLARLAAEFGQERLRVYLNRFVWTVLYFQDIAV